MTVALERVDQTQAIALLEAFLPAPPDVDVALEVENASVSFGGLRAVNEVSLTVPSRSLVGLIGPNGAGKSTLFDIINGLRTPDEGRVTLFGTDVTALPCWDRAALGMSRTFQSNRVSLELTVADNLLVGAYRTVPGGVMESILGLPRVRAAQARALSVAGAVAEMLDLSDAWDLPAGDLDFGRQRRIEIGRSIMSAPRLLLLDEPAAGLDNEESAHLFALVRRLEADLGLTVLLVEHYVRAVLENCDLVYVLNEGALIAGGPPAEIAVHPEVRAAYLGAEDDEEEDLEEADDDEA
jgi:ABC-type branched-subunit amino acid transport system ATPase component